MFGTLGGWGKVMALLNSCRVEELLEILVGIKIPGSMSSG